MSDWMIDLGPCCSCEKTGADVRNIIALPRLAPVPGTGWACIVCGLPADGAQAVLCDECMATGRRIIFVVNGYIGDRLRLPISELSADIFEHRLEYHPEVKIAH